MSIYKEAFLWMGDAIKVSMGDIKKPQMDELEAYFKTVDKSQMKMIEKKDGSDKNKPLDIYDFNNSIKAIVQFWTGVNMLPSVKA